MIECEEIKMKKMLILGCGALVTAAMMTTANAAVNEQPTQNWQCTNQRHENCINQEDCLRYNTDGTYQTTRGNHQSRCNNNGRHHGNN